MKNLIFVFTALLSMSTFASEFCNLKINKNNAPDKMVAMAKKEAVKKNFVLVDSDTMADYKLNLRQEKKGHSYMVRGMDKVQDAIEAVVSNYQAFSIELTSVSGVDVYSRSEEMSGFGPWSYFSVQRKAKHFIKSLPACENGVIVEAH